MPLPDDTTATLNQIKICVFLATACMLAGLVTTDANIVQRPGAFVIAAFLLALVLGVNGFIDSRR